jgi:hypothetical protein
MPHPTWVGQRKMKSTVEESQTCVMMTSVLHLTRHGHLCSGTQQIIISVNNDIMIFEGKESQVQYQR